MVVDWATVHRITGVQSDFWLWLWEGLQPCYSILSTTVLLGQASDASKARWTRNKGIGKEKNQGFASAITNICMI
jgi:hypothetical protein